MLRATTACDISTSKRVRAEVFCTFCWKCASRHNGVQFISHPSWLRTRRFSEPDPPEPQIIGKTQCFANLFAHLHLLSSVFSLLTLFTSAFQLSILSDLLNFLRIPVQDGMREVVKHLGGVERVLVGVSTIDVVSLAMAFSSANNMADSVVR